MTCTCVVTVSKENVLMLDITRPRCSKTSVAKKLKVTFDQIKTHCFSHLLSQEQNSSTNQMFLDFSAKILSLHWSSIEMSLMFLDICFRSAGGKLRR